MMPVDDVTAAKAAEVIALLSNPDDYKRWLAEMRGVIAAADSKLASLKAAEAKSANAERLLADATNLLAKQEAHAQQIRDEEANLRERTEQSEARIKAADEEAARQKADIVAEKRLLANLGESLRTARNALVELKASIDAEWAELGLMRGRLQEQKLH
jgi:chromosome segregation ATPase